MNNEKLIKLPKQVEELSVQMEDIAKHLSGCDILEGDISKKLNDEIIKTREQTTLLFKKSEYILSGINVNKSMKFDFNGSIIKGVKKDGKGYCRQIINSTVATEKIEFKNGTFDLLKEEGETTTDTTPRFAQINIENCNEVVFDNITFINATTQTGGEIIKLLKDRIISLIRVVGYEKITIKNCKVSNCNGEVFWLVPKNEGFADIYDNVFQQDGKSYGSGITIIDGKTQFKNNVFNNYYNSPVNLLVKNSIISNNIINTVTNSHGIDLIEGGIYTGSNNLIENNIIQNVSENGIAVGGSDTIVRNNIINAKNYGVAFIQIYNSSNADYGDFTATPVQYKNVSIENNKIYGADIGIFVNGRNNSATSTKAENPIINVIIKENNIHDTTKESVCLQNVKNVFVDNNLLEGWGKIMTGSSSRGSAIVLQTLIDTITITNNAFESVSDYNCISQIGAWTIFTSKDFTIKNNKMNELSKLNLYICGGSLIIKNNVGLTSSNAICLFPLGHVIIECGDIPKITYSVSIPIKGYYNKGDTILKNTNNLSGWKCTFSGYASFDRVGNTASKTDRYYKYSNGNVFYVDSLGTFANTEPNIEGLKVGESINDGTCTVVKISETSATFVEF